jgi:hypothetical protein
MINARTVDGEIVYIAIQHIVAVIHDDNRPVTGILTSPGVLYEILTPASQIIEVMERKGMK